MKQDTAGLGADLQGAARLVVDATAGLTDLVEAVHERIARWPGSAAVSGAKAGRTRGLTGLVYRSIRAVTGVAGGSVDALLRLLAPALNRLSDLPEREAIIAALNGVLGDHLVATGNPLATKMSLRPAADDADAGGPVLLLIHGLCMNDLQWTREGHNHGLALARELGFRALFLRYNSGQHISTNGWALALALQALVNTQPQLQRDSRLVIIGHSMGGLVARSAVHFARQAEMTWPHQLTDLVFLGTPHHGAPLERAGHWIDTVLNATPYAAPFARLGRIRSAGITDLRHAALLDSDWQGADPSDPAWATRPPEHLPLPSGVRCFAVASHLGVDGADLKGRLLGDGLVPLASALGQHPDAARCLAFEPERTWTGSGIGHLQLLSDPRVHGQFRHWLGASPT